MLYLIIVCFAMFYCYHLEACCFLTRDRNGVDLDEEGRGGKRKGGKEDLEGVEGEETLMKIYCLRKKSIFSKKEKSNNKTK